MPNVDLPDYTQADWHIPLNATLTQINTAVDELAVTVASGGGGGGGGAVSSVNGKTGIVVLVVDDISDTASATRKYLTPAERAKLLNLSGVNTGDQSSVTGNAGTASRLQTARTINGVSFDGSANITIAATFDAEAARDTLATALVAGNSISITHNDAADTITIGSTLANPVGGDGTITKIVRKTQQEFNAIPTPDPNTYYVIVN